MLCFFVLPFLFVENSPPALKMGHDQWKWYEHSEADRDYHAVFQNIFSSCSTKTPILKVFFALLLFCFCQDIKYASYLPFFLSCQEIKFINYLQCWFSFLFLSRYIYKIVNSHVHVQIFIQTHMNKLKGPNHYILTWFFSSFLTQVKNRMHTHAHTNGLPCAIRQNLRCKTQSARSAPCGHILHSTRDQKACRNCCSHSSNQRTYSLMKSTVHLHKIW